MASAPTMFRVEVLAEEEWFRLRDVRLSALKENPQAFLSTFELESTYHERRWRAEFARGEWIVVVTNGRAAGLLGATREPATPLHECNFEYLWISPESRRARVASMLLGRVLERLRDAGVVTVWLWILDGNEPARRLYESVGFQSTNERQSLPADPARSEERMRLSLR